MARAKIHISGIDVDWEERTVYVVATLVEHPIYKEGQEWTGWVDISDAPDKDEFLQRVLLVIEGSLGLTDLKWTGDTALYEELVDGEFTTFSQFEPPISLPKTLPQV